jgi:hypothetical protein
LPEGSLLVTGGSLLLSGSLVISYSGEREAVRLDVGTFAVSLEPPMLTARWQHAAVYHSQYVYVLAGINGRWLSDCERYVFAESRWEVLPDLPAAGYRMSAVELENSLYALGGFFQGES